MPGSRERWTCQFGDVPSTQLLFSMTGLEVARSHLRRSWEGGAVPATAAALIAGRLQMSLALAPRAGAAWHRRDPFSCGASAPELQWQLLAERQGQLGFGSARQKRMAGEAGTDRRTRHSAWRGGLRWAVACRRVNLAAAVPGCTNCRSAEGPGELQRSIGIKRYCAVLQGPAESEGTGEMPCTFLCPVNPQATEGGGKGRFLRHVCGNYPSRLPEGDVHHCCMRFL